MTIVRDMPDLGLPDLGFLFTLTVSFVQILGQFFSPTSENLEVL
jgi:hypothetical protein